MASSVQLLQPTSQPFQTSSRPDLFAPIQGLDSCSTMAELKQYHSCIIKLGLSNDNDAVGRVIKFCSLAEAGDLNYALKAFDTLPRPDVFIYNTIIKGFLQFGFLQKCIVFYFLMLQKPSIKPNSFTFPLVIRACCLASAVQLGKQVHAHVFKFGFGSDLVSQNNLIHMYVNFRCLDEAKTVFDNLHYPNIVSWTTLISGYAQFGYIDEAFKIFESAPAKHPALWNAMIAAYVQSSRFMEAFALFDRMRSENVVIDKFVAASMLSACSGLGSLEQGRWIYKYIKKSGIETDSKLATTIIDMYSKCGCYDKALEVFNRLSSKGISSWNCMIGGLAIHGKGEAAIELFKEMEREGLRPDNITFLNILSACSHSGLVEEGRHYFDYMTDAYGIIPRMEHYGCMVDLLGRAGLLEEARALINKMPWRPDVGVLGAFLGACVVHKNFKLGEEIGQQVIELDPQNSGRYVLLANLYASAGRWEDVANVRKLMSDRGVEKEVGSSVIEVEGFVSKFTAGERDHPEAEEIYAKVKEILEYIKSVGYVPDNDGGIWLDFMEEEEKEDQLYFHSEKLAIAYGLLKSREGETLRITKNLRVCKDCHQATKLISKVYGREIVVRDRNRFHHFKGGECSCKDYW